MRAHGCGYQPSVDASSPAPVQAQVLVVIPNASLPSTPHINPTANPAHSPDSYCTSDILIHLHEIIAVPPESPSVCPCPPPVSSLHGREITSRLKSDGIIPFSDFLVVAILCLGENPTHCKRPYKAHVIWPPPTTFLLFFFIFLTHVPSGVHTFSLFLPHFPSTCLSGPPLLHFSLCTLVTFSEPSTFPD